MEILKNQPLASHITMKLGGDASYMAEVTTESDLQEAIAFAKERSLNVMVLGGGSNIIFGDKGYDGLVIINEIKGVTIDEQSGVVRAGSGENWDDLVAASVAHNLAGIEALSLIPGTVGAAPVNNIGAYGQEVKDTITRVRAYDTQANAMVELTNKECQFSYRNSVFKTLQYGRYIITSVTFQLHVADDAYSPPSYASVQTMLQNQNITEPSVKTIRDIVINIRKAKLPDPAVLANTGSFFKNPIVTKDICNNLLLSYPTMPYFEHNNNVKLAAGWLIEAAGLKGLSKDGIRVYDKQALVLVNDGTRSFQSLLNMKNLIQQTVFDKFGVMLEPEPEIIT